MKQLNFYKKGNSFKAGYVNIEAEHIERLEQMETIQQKRLYATQHGISFSSGTKTLEECLEELKEWEAIALLRKDQPDRLALIVEALPDALLNVDWKHDYSFWDKLFSKHGGSFGDD